MKKLKRLWNRAPRLSRGWQITLNLVLCALLCVWMWALADYPLPTVELEFRRLERSYFLPKSEIIFNSAEYGPVQWGELPNLEFDQDVVVGQTEDQVYAANLLYSTMDVYPLREGITPVPLDMFATIFEPGNVHWERAVMFLNVPEEAERAEVEVDVFSCVDEPLHRRGDGWRLAPGRWIFCVDPGEEDFLWYDGTYTLRLYRADGSLLLEESGDFGEG